jgi:mono/diheme cytochrome c family protein
LRGIIVSALLMLGAASLGAAAISAPSPAHFADGDNVAAVANGHAIYETVCAACHGRNLEGQPLWQVDDQYAHRRAPAHDASGHTWMHSDEALFQMVKTGRFPDWPKDATSYMPAYGGHLSDGEIVAVLAFIKSRWPLGLRVSQALLNPGLAGMPKDADKVEWTLPPTCTASYQRWKTISR